MSDSEPDALSNDVYRIVVLVNVRTSALRISCGGLAPQLVRVALELAADDLADKSVWTITAENFGEILAPATIPDVEDDE